MVELYVEDLKKSIKELELDKELEKYVFIQVLGLSWGFCCCHYQDAVATLSFLVSMT